MKRKNLAFRLFGSMSVMAISQQLMDGLTLKKAVSFL